MAEKCERSKDETGSHIILLAVGLSGHEYFKSTGVKERIDCQAQAMAHERTNGKNNAQCFLEATEGQEATTNNASHNEALSLYNFKKRLRQFQAILCPKSIPVACVSYHM